MVVHQNVAQRIRAYLEKTGHGVEKEAPLYSARVMLVCPKCGQAARVSHGYLADGTKIRVCKNCGEQIEK